MLRYQVNTILNVWIWNVWRWVSLENLRFEECLFLKEPLPDSIILHFCLKCMNMNVKYMNASTNSGYQCVNRKNQKETLGLGFWNITLVPFSCEELLRLENGGNMTKIIKEKLRWNLSLLCALNWDERNPRDMLEG